MDPNSPNGESVETPAGSQPEIQTPEPQGDVNASASAPLSPEEVAWNSLKGNTQDRIKDILRERDQYRAEAERLKTSPVSNQNYYTSPQTDLSSQDPQVRDAVQKLSKVGIATKDEVNELVNQRVGNLIYNFTLQDLEKKHDGANGEPRFDRAEYEDFINRNPKYRNYDPEDVYEKMYSQELMDARMKPHGNGGQSSSASLRPNKTVVREEQWTPEAVEERMKQSDGRDWYVQNRALVNKVLASQTPKAE